MTRAIAGLAIVGLAWFGGCQYAENRQAGERIARLEDARDSLARVAHERDTVYRTDTLRLTQVRRHIDSVYLTTTDTVIHRDTVIQLVLHERAACDAAVKTCEQRVADRDRQIVNLDSLLTLERKRGGSPWKTKLGWLLAGAAAGVILQ